ncbi:bifunctional class I SAM-dependent methyltransferase/HIT family protein [Gracilimonas sp.]|uniref:HIT family protein n=1 Tax=Gracilimonas sp. TaxID=1974203 RepID=UPI002871ED18|nr:bifunctional class I SAM-dependent methyltransferase/HIT family protein [Gracilimonas sp.]
MKGNPNSHLTAKERDKESFPTRKLYKMGVIKGNVLDFGSGYGKDAEFLQSKNISCTNYDPYHAPDYPDQKFDTILCQYVLNVLFPEEQAEVLMSVSELLKSSGKAYFTVRRDLKRTGFRNHYVHRVPTYQCNVVLPYKTIFKNEFCEIYEYLHFTQVDNGKKGIFENPSPETELISELATVYSIYDKFPVSKGHALVLPKRKSANYFEMTDKEKTACQIMVERVKDILTKKYQPDGFNIGFNVNKAAGQTISHTHIHIIPRYKGDVENPRGGIRNVIPGMGDY